MYVYSHLYGAKLQKIEHCIKGADKVIKGENEILTLVIVKQLLCIRLFQGNEKTI